MSTRTYVQGCGYHEMAYVPPELVVRALQARGFEVEVKNLDQSLRTSLVLVKKRV